MVTRKLYKFIRGVEGKGKYPPEVDWVFRQKSSYLVFKQAKVAQNSPKWEVK